MALTRYNKRTVVAMADTLEDWINQSQETLYNEESRDYPNDDRIDSLTTRIDSLQNALDALDEIE